MSDEALITEQNELKIIDLNDDCLFAILKFLHINDLIHLSCAHERFNSTIMLLLPKISVQINGSSVPKPEHLGNFIKDFGGLFKEFSIINLRHIPFSYVKMIEGLLTEYCANGNVEKCAFKNGKITKEFTIISRLFESLKSLELENVNIFDGSLNAVKHGKSLNELILRSKMLTELKVDTCTTDIRDLLTTINTCPNIESVKLIYLKRDYAEIYLNRGGRGRGKQRTAEEITTLRNARPTDRNLPICSSVKGLKILNCHDVPGMLKDFANLEMLSFSFYTRRWFEPILALNMLKELHILGGYAQDEIYLLFRQLNVNLEVLHIYLASLELTNSISKMTNLKELYLGSDHSFKQNCVNLASNLANLRIFHFNGYLDIRNDILCEPSMVIDFIRIAENLQTFAFQTRKDPSNEADELYERLVDVCTAENRRTVLNVNVVVFLDGLAKEVFLYKSKWLKMRIFERPS